MAMVLPRCDQVETYGFLSIMAVRVINRFGMVLDGSKKHQDVIDAFLGCKQRNFEGKLGTQ
jgi:hypothetical protein